MTVPMPHDRKLLWTDRPETEVAAATAAAVAVAEEPSPRPCALGRAAAAAGVRAAVRQVAARIIELDPRRGTLP